MKLLYKIICFLLVPFSIIIGQVPDNYYPKIKYVSIVNTDGNVRIEWTHSQDPDFDEYEIWRIDPGGLYTDLLLGTVAKDINYYTDATANTNENAYGYRVRATRPPDEPWASNIHNTMLLSVTKDICEDNLKFSWTPYDGWKEDGSDVDYYYLIKFSTFKISKDFGQSTDTTYINEYTIPKDTTYYWIRAVNSDNSDIYAISNPILLVNPIPLTPDYIYADYAIMEAENQLRLQFSIDTLSGTTEYKIIREDGNNKETIWEDSLYTSHIINFTDNEIDETKEYKYYVNAYKCNEIIKNVEISYANNIVLSHNIDGSKIKLYWNDFDAWANENNNYNLYRAIDNGDFELITSTNGFNFDEDARQISLELNGGISGVNRESIIPIAKIHYFIETINSNNDTCISNQVHVIPDSPPNLATAIITNDPTNNKFSPNFLFLPKEYKMVIYDKGGSKVWYTDDPKESWTGYSIFTNEIVPDGIYFYIIKRSDQEGNKKKPEHGIVHVISSIVN